MSKFNLLTIGQRFRWNDETYRKISPLLAVNEATGAHRLVPRAAVLQTFEDSAPASTPAKTHTLRADAVIAALATHLEACLEAVGACAISPETQAALEQRIRASDAGLRAQLGLD